MKILSITHHVRRFRSRTEFVEYLVVHRVVRLFGIRIWTTEIDRENVPSWAQIQRCCLGYTDWESRLFEQHKQLLEQ